MEPPNAGVCLLDVPAHLCPATWTASLAAAAGCRATERPAVPAATRHHRHILTCSAATSHQPCPLDPSSRRHLGFSLGETPRGPAKGLVFAQPPQEASASSGAVLPPSPLQRGPGGVGACPRVPGRKVYVDIEYTSAPLPAGLCVPQTRCQPTHRVGECGNLGGAALPRASAQAGAASTADGEQAAWGTCHRAGPALVALPSSPVSFLFSVTH